MVIEVDKIVIPAMLFVNANNFDQFVHEQSGLTTSNRIYRSTLSFQNFQKIVRF